ncbi:hypothetical protein V6N12_042174 [Hibiscus sabdariffa]|uniref:Uncharacterized protein n=1 Tax=Hibiscus sabdariffa TaxID=183260 RepID=A0ABR2EFK3_9ROSI
MNSERDRYGAELAHLILWPNLSESGSEKSRSFGFETLSKLFKLVGPLTFWPQRLDKFKSSASKAIASNSVKAITVGVDNGELELALGQELLTTKVPNFQQTSVEKPLLSPSLGYTFEATTYNKKHLGTASPSRTM